MLAASGSECIAMHWGQRGHLHYVLHATHMINYSCFFSAMFMELWIMELTFAIWIPQYIRGGFYVPWKHCFVWIKGNMCPNKRCAFQNVVLFQHTPRNMPTFFSCWHCMHCVKITPQPIDVNRGSVKLNCFVNIGRHTLLYFIISLDFAVVDGVVFMGIVYLV